MGAAVRGVRRGVRAVVGEWHWLPPRYLGASAAQLQRAGRAARARPALTAGVLVLAVAVGAAGVAAWRWWQAQPKPVEVTVDVAPIGRTVIEEDEAPHPLRVKFSRAVAPLAQVGKSLTLDTEDGVSVSPAIDGTWTWTSDRVLEFQPKADWPVGTPFTATLGRRAVVPEVRLASRDIAFTSPLFTAEIAKAEFYEDPSNPALKQVVVDVAFSHPVDPATLEKRLRLADAGASSGLLGLGANSTPVTVSYDKFKLHAYVHSQSLAIPADDKTMTFTLTEGVSAARGGTPLAAALQATVDIPGLYNLHLDRLAPTVVTNDKNEPEQVLVVQTNRRISDKEIGQALKVWELPLHHPGRKRRDDDAPYPWRSLDEVTDAVIKAGRLIALDAVPTEHEHEVLHSYRYRADVGRTLLVQIDKGVKSFGGYVLGERQLKLVRVPAFPSELRILSRGALLSMSGEKKVAVLVRDLPGVRMEIGRVLPGQLQHLVSQSSGRFDNPNFFGSFGRDNLTERFERKVALPDLQRGRAHYEAIDLGEYLKKDGEQRRGIFLLTVQGYDPDNPDGDWAPAEGAGTDESDAEGELEGGEDAVDEGPAEIPPSQRVDRRLVVVTDMGLIAKRELDGTQVVFVQSIHTGQPMAGATVEVIARNGAVIHSATTDAAGVVRFPKLDNLSRERAAQLFLARKGGDMSFLPLGRYDRELDTSRFDVGGVANARQADQLSAYLFSDRGIYRPGERMHVGMIVKSADWGRPGARALNGVPLQVEVLDPRGLSVRRERIVLAAGGFNELTQATLETSPTGLYTVNLYTIKDGRAHQQIGSTQVKVQEFEPDRMKVTAHLSSEASDGWVHPKDLKGRISAFNLFGTPAENRRIESTLTLAPAYPAFRSYPGYAFYDPQRAKESYSDKLADARTAANGEAEFDLGLDRFARATYRLTLLSRVFEPEGGRSVSAAVGALVSDQPYLVGMKADGALDYVSRASAREVSLIAIDPQARKTAVNDLRLQFVERRFVSVLTRQDNGTYQYESRKKEVMLKEMPLALAATGHTLALDTTTAGSFAYVVRNAQGQELNRIEYSVAGRGNVTRSLERNAELQLVLDRKDYAPGDEISVSIRAPYVGAGLITIERDKVYAQQWFKADTLASVQKIRVPKDFEGNGYVSVQFVRDPSSDEIFMSPLSWGIVPFATSLSARTQTLTLNAPDRVKPGQKLTLTLKAAAPTRAVVYAVDEGILQVARYTPPDPLSHFFQKRMLDVRTSQILDLILPEFKKLMDAAAPGGDAEGALARHLNPFKRKRDKPGVWWSGIIDVKAEQELSWVVPDTFNGSLRLMAVAVNDGQIGTAQARTQVRGDFVLSPNLPVAVTPGDEFEVSVGVSNLVAGSGKEAAVQVTVVPPAAMEVVGAASQTLRIGEQREGVAVYRVRVRDARSVALGSAPLAFTATLGDKSARVAAEVSVRPASPRTTTLSVGSFKGTVDVALKRDLHAEHRQVEAGVSALPLVVTSGLTHYLAGFEHACTEQVVSQAMPATVLAQRPEFAAGAGRPDPKAIERAVRVLRARQNGEGGFGLWQASVQADEFASVYAVHWMLEARDRSQAVPPDMLRAGLSYLDRLAGTPANDLFAARTRAYAIYVLTREGTVTTPYLSRLRESLDTRFAKQWTGDLTAVWMAATYQLLKQEAAARALIDPPVRALQQASTPDWRSDFYYDPLVHGAGVLYVLSRHFPERARALSPETLMALMKPVADNRFNTLSAALTVLALDAYAGVAGPAAAGKLSIVALGASGQEQLLALPDTLVPRVAVAPGVSRLRYGYRDDGAAYYALSESGFDRAPSGEVLRQGLELVRDFLDAKGQTVTQVKVGDEVTVRVRVRAVDRPSVWNLAIVDLLPGGFEPVLAPKGAETATTDNAWKAPLVTGGSWRLSYADIRDDRVVLYGNASSEMAEFTYRIKATNAGKFVVPPLWGEGLYARDVRARSAGGVIVVDKPAP